jgi:hypothetical protein
VFATAPSYGSMALPVPHPFGNDLHGGRHATFGSDRCAYPLRELTHGLIVQRLSHRPCQMDRGQSSHGYRWWPSPECVDALPPVGLIGKERDHQGREPCPQTGRHRARTPVMPGRSDPRE